MHELLKRLKPRERRGSKPRCHWLTHGGRAAVAERLTALAAGLARVSSDDVWMPDGFVDVEEAQLDKAEALLPRALRAEIGDWWLEVRDAASMTPNWDIASTCTVDGLRGLILVEAKAHDQELLKASAGRPLDDRGSVARSANHDRIGRAIAEANDALARSTGLKWSLSRDSHYQLSNRFAWSWKLAASGVPVVLVYFGFLRAAEMSDKGLPLHSATEWEETVRGHAAGLVPENAWSATISCGSATLTPVIRAGEVPLDGPSDDFAVESSAFGGTPT